MADREPIQADGVNVIDCGTIGASIGESWPEGFFWVENRQGGYGFDLSKIVRPAKYRVLLERIE